MSTNNPPMRPQPVADTHHIARLAISLDRLPVQTYGQAPVRWPLFAPDTQRIRTGLLATMVDLVAGHTPDSPHGPTIDLRTSIFAPPPTSGFVHLHTRPLRVGKRLIVAETELSAERDGAAFGRAITTFMNNPLGPGVPSGMRSTPPMDESFDAFIAPRVRNERALELDANDDIANESQGTVQGGVQAFLAELTAEHALVTAGQGTRWCAVDLDIRYLSRLVGRTLVAEVVAAHAHPTHPSARVNLIDDSTGVLVSFVAITMAAS